MRHCLLTKICLWSRITESRNTKQALLTKYLYKFCQVASFPTKVGSFWWRDCCFILNEFKEIAICNIQYGSTGKLWYDKWHDEKLLVLYPQLFSFAKDKDITIASAHVFAMNGFYDMFHLPMSSIVV